MDETMTYGPIVINEAPTNLIPELIDKRFHVVYTDRKMFVAGQSWTEGYDLTNSWIFSTNNIKSAHRIAAEHYVHSMGYNLPDSMIHPVLLIDSETGTYLDIDDNEILFVYNRGMAHERWINLLRLLSDDENSTLFSILYEAEENCINQDTRDEIGEITADLIEADLSNA